MYRYNIMGRYINTRELIKFTETTLRDLSLALHRANLQNSPIDGS